MTRKQWKSVTLIELKERILEIDLLRTISIMIVVLMIHIPNNYAYNFYIELDRYTGFLLHTLGIDVALGSFAFLSGFGLYIQKSNREINSSEKLLTFFKKRFLRIYPLYWIALVLFFFFFDFYWGMNVIYLIAHFVGLQMIFAPLFSPPIWTLWFIGIIVIYYLIFILLSYLGSIKRIIPASLVILAFFLFLHFNYNLVEYRLFVYYPTFIIGIIIAEVYRSPYFSNIKEKLTNIHHLIPLLIMICSIIIGWILYTRLARFTYLTYLRNYRTQFLGLIVEQQLPVFEFVAILLLTDCVIVAFIVFILPIFNLSIRVFTLIIDKMYVNRAILLVSYSTYAVYLFHRPFLITFNTVMLTVFNIDMLEKSNFYLTSISIPLLFILAFLIQKLADKGIPVLYQKLSDKMPATNL